jgi:amino acid transporter
VTGGTYPRGAERRPLSAIQLAALIYFTTCGGPFGLEPLVGAVGPAWSATLVLLTPLVWSLPVAMLVAELTAMMPAEGGYYIWVRESLGPFWAMMESWWTLASSLTVIAVYPVLFTGYLGYFLPDLLGPSATDPAVAEVLRQVISILVIGSVVALNVRGSMAVGRASTFTALFVIGSFSILVVYGLVAGGGVQRIASVLARDAQAPHPGALLLGLSLVVFNFSGWDNASTYAAEVEDPSRTYPRALGIALLGLVVSYLVPILVGVGVTSDPAVWNSDAGWPVIARQVGGPLFGSLIAFGGLVSMWSLLNAQVLYVSRVPFVMALDGWFPAVFARVSPRTGAPSVAIMLTGAAAMVMTFVSFEGLTIIYCLVYTASLVLEFLALLLLRRRRPEVARPFRIPGGRVGLWLACSLPAVVSVGVLYAALRDWRQYRPAFALLAALVATGLALYWARRGRYERVIEGLPEPSAAPVPQDAGVAAATA